MSLHLPKATLSRSTLPIRTRSVTHPRRTLFEWIRKRKAPSDNLPPMPFDPQSAEFAKKRADAKAAASGQNTSAVRGDIASSSIFDDPADRHGEGGELVQADRAAIRARRMQFDPYLAAPALDPNPRARRRWLQRQVAMAVRNRGAVSKDIIRKRNEREHLLKSEWLPTSIKKLTPLARQVSGKSVDEALVQLRFSKKLVAKDVMRILETARAEAIAARGMGLGVHLQEAAEVEGAETTSANAVADGAGPDSADAGASSSKEKTASNSGGEFALERTTEEASTMTTPSSPTSTSKAPSFTPITILDKKGKRRIISDPTSIYIAQAWVGRGPYGKVPEYRARGKMNLLRPPYTNISFLLKEDKTRLREARDREEREKKKKPWIHHPDRPISQQRQYLMW